jgi:hypothetical protein
VNFSPPPYSTNFDAESIISYGDSLYIFTKNWGDNRCSIYPLPKTPGSYQLARIDSLDPQGLITGACFNSASNSITLVGSSSWGSPFIVEIKAFYQNNFSGGLIYNYPIYPQIAFQVESITPLNNYQYYITSEKDLLGNDPTLYRLDTNPLVGDKESNEYNDLFHPNPASEYINIQHNDYKMVEVFDQNGSVILSSDKKQINVKELKPGSYLLCFHFISTNDTIVRKLIVK